MPASVQKVSWQLLEQQQQLPVTQQTSDLCTVLVVAMFAQIVLSLGIILLQLATDHLDQCYRMMKRVSIGIATIVVEAGVPVLVALGAYDLKLLHALEAIAGTAVGC